MGLNEKFSHDGGTIAFFGARAAHLSPSEIRSLATTEGLMAVTAQDMDGNETLVFQAMPEWMEKPIVPDGPGKQSGAITHQKFRLCIDRNPQRLHSQSWAIWGVLLVTYNRLGNKPVCMADLWIGGCPYGPQDYNRDREKGFIEELT